VARQVLGSARRFTIAALVFVVLGVSAPIATAAQRANGGGVGLGNPSADANVPQIPAQANVTAVRAWIERAISVRLVALREFHAAATVRSALTASDRSLIVAQIATDRAGLDALAKSVRSDTAVPQLQDEIDAVITNYRVFTVVVPEVEMAIRLDAFEVGVARIAQIEAKISAAVATANALGDPGKTQQTYDALVSEVQTANGLLQTAHSAVLTLVPSSYPQAAQIFTSAQQAITSAREDITAAKLDINEIVLLLRKKLKSVKLVE
jgi:hypothetical protein